MYVWWEFNVAADYYDDDIKKPAIAHSWVKKVWDNSGPLVSFQFKPKDGSKCTVKLRTPAIYMMMQTCIALFQVSSSKTEG